MVEKEKPAVIEAADTVNDVVEDLALTAAGIVGDGDPEHIAGTTNEQVYIPEATEAPAPSSAPDSHANNPKATGKKHKL